MADWDRGKAMMFMTSPLGADVLIPTRLVAEEQISQPFTFEIEAVSQHGRIEPDHLLNKAVCVTIQDKDGPIRHFHGMARKVRSQGIVRGKTSASTFEAYALTVVPVLWFLNQTLDCRVFEKKTVKEIIQAVFADAGLTDVSFHVEEGASRVCTVQYNETDYDFVTRLMEEEGWFYYFEHTAAKHTLIVTDKNGTFTDIPNGTLRFVPLDANAEGIFDWKAAATTEVGAVTLADHDPVNPGTKLHAEEKTILKTAGAAGRDVYRWPALTATGAMVESRAKFEMEAAEAVASLYEGESLFPALVTGGIFKVKNSPGHDDDGDYVSRTVRHVVRDDSWLTNEGVVSYRNSFQAFKKSTRWRQPMVTPRPRMAGVHLGIVMGPQSTDGDTIGAIKMQSGEEIQVDDLASVRVRFFWDHRGNSSGSLAMWARVVQPWAGNGWGMQFNPRVGTEVAVAFADGDPDRPIVLGGMYNGISKPIYPKGENTKSGIRTRSSLSGSNSQFNELTFDDKSGSEQIFIHAEKDMLREVEHDDTLTVGNDRSHTVTGNETIEVKKDQTVTIDGNRTETVKKDESITIDGARTEKVSKDETVSIDGKREVKISGKDALEVSGDIAIESKGAISIKAASKITLTVGGSSITIDAQNITIKAAMKVSIEGDLEVDVKGTQVKVSGDATLDLKSPMTTLGDTMTTVKGQMVSISGSLIKIG